MVYPNSNLPSVSQPWGREVQKNLETLQGQFLSDRTNNTARDAQLQASYKRLDSTVIQVAAAADQAQDAADAAAAAASTANSAASAALAAANTANSAIAILSSLTTATYYPGTSTTWSGNNLNALLIDYYGSTYIDIPEPGGARKVIVTAVFDVDMNTTTAAAATATSQSATARMYGTSTATNSISSGGSRGSNANIGIYGGGSLTVTGTYDVTSSGTLSWNPDLTIVTGSSGTFSGSANLRFVTVVITKV